MSYKLLPNNMIRHPNGHALPMVDSNDDYEEYKRWVAAGNTADPADPPPPVFAPLNFGGAADDEGAFRQTAQAGVDTLRSYLQNDSPTGAQTVAALKLVIRVALFFVRRAAF